MSKEQLTPTQMSVIQTKTKLANEYQFFLENPYVYIFYTFF